MEMKTKTIYANTIEEALQKIKKELGKDAVIIHSEKKTAKDSEGYVKTVFEITATSGNDKPESESDNSKVKWTLSSSMLEDDVEDMIDESLIETSVEEMRIAEGIGWDKYFKKGWK